MKKGIGILLAIVIGSLLGYFGALVSVFADAGLPERMITMGIVLLVYVILSALWGYLLPYFSWMWGIFLASPGACFIIIFFTSEPKAHLLVYAILIIGLSSLGGKIGSSIKAGRNK